MKKTITYTTLFILQFLLVACETTHTMLGIDYSNWKNVSGNGDYKNKTTDTFYVCQAPYFTSNVATHPPIKTTITTLKECISQYAKVYSPTRQYSDTEAINEAKKVGSDYTIIVYIDSQQNRGYFASKGDSILITLSMYKTSSSKHIYTKSLKIVAQNRGVFSTSLPTVIKRAIPSYVKTMFN